MYVCVCVCVSVCVCLSLLNTLKDTFQLFRLHSVTPPHPSSSRGPHAVVTYGKPYLRIPPLIDLCT